MNFLNDFILLLKARYPIIYISTYEEERIEYIIRLCCKKYISRTYYSWDFINGYQGNPNDSGQTLNIIKNFWKIKPILGVCLGHQCIGSIFGSSVVESKKILHGKTSTIYHNGSDLFSGVKSPFQAARYHSLCIDSVPENFDSIAWTEEKEIMGISHMQKPVFGIQFHPESFLTPRGDKIISNFLNLF